MEWINTAKPLKLAELKGRFVLLDFWTYCCINCLHVLPELKKLEAKYPNELVVIGVHTAKFDSEKVQENIREAVLRYEIKHPVVNDANQQIWNSYGVRSWPTMLLIDPTGKVVYGRPGEFKFSDIDRLLQAAIPYYESKKLINRTPLRFDLAADADVPTPLRFPGKILADAASNRLFIADSNHNRIVIATLEGELLEIIGTGAIGRADGGFSEASFDHPQGIALHDEQLFVADTENHLLRRIDLEQKTVHTVAGTGVKATAWPGLTNWQPGLAVPKRFYGPPLKTPLNSPWALCVHKSTLYLAMAGPHQIWSMPLDASEIGAYAGNGREDIVDGPLMPRSPYARGFCSFAQPSGLTSDGTWLYVADSEGSSIRAVPFDPRGKVRTIVGTADLPGSRLFTFGDVDGPRHTALLQHALGITYHEGKLYVADTYNNKIKIVDPRTGEVRTLAGTGKPGEDDMPSSFDEPAGMTYAAGRLFVADTNNHLIRAVDIVTGKVTTLTIKNLKPPTRGRSN